MTVLLALLLLQPAAEPRAEAERLFALGTTLIAEGDTAGAVAAWEGARTTGWTSVAVEHNLGTVALRQGDAGRARLHLERAARLAPRDDAVMQNLRLARRLAGEAPRSGWQRSWDRVVAIVRPLGLVALALGLAFGALGLFVLERRRWAASVGAAAVVAVAAASGALWERSRPLGVVLAAEADVREAPSPAAPSVARLRAGEVAEVGAEEAGWRHVEVGSVAGWVPTGTVEPL